MNSEVVKGLASLKVRSVGERGANGGRGGRTCTVMGAPSVRRISPSMLVGVDTLGDGGGDCGLK